MSLSLAEFEARCLGQSPGEITPDDVTKAYSRVSAMGEAYRERLFAKADQWKPKPRTRRATSIEAKKCGIEKSLPNGDKE